MLKNAITAKNAKADKKLKLKNSISTVTINNIDKKIKFFFCSRFKIEINFFSFANILISF